MPPKERLDNRPQASQEEAAAITELKGFLKRHGGNASAADFYAANDFFAKNHVSVKSFCLKFSHKFELRDNRVYIVDSRPVPAPAPAPALAPALALAPAYGSEPSIEEYEAIARLKAALVRSDGRVTPTEFYSSASNFFTKHHISAKKFCERFPRKFVLDDTFVYLGDEVVSDLERVNRSFPLSHGELRIVVTLKTFVENQPGGVLTMNNMKSFNDSYPAMKAVLKSVKGYIKAICDRSATAYNWNKWWLQYIPLTDSSLGFGQVTVQTVPPPLPTSAVGADVGGGAGGGAGGGVAFSPKKANASADNSFDFNPFEFFAEPPVQVPADEAADCPYDTIYVFHDAENCPLPSRYETRTRDGELVKDGSRVRFHDGPVDYPQGGGYGPIQGAVVYLEVVRSALACRMGRAAADKVDIMADLNVNYDFILLANSSNPFHPSSATLNALSDFETTLVSVPQREGSVDKKLKERFCKALKTCRMFDEEQRKKVLFVLISGDCDFNSDILDARRAKIDIVLLHSQDNPARESIIHLLRPSFSTCSWLNIVHKARADGCKPNPNAAVKKLSFPSGADVVTNLKDRAQESGSTDPPFSVRCSVPQHFFINQLYINELRDMVGRVHPRLTVTLKSYERPDKRRIGTVLQWVVVVEEIPSYDGSDLTDDAIPDASKEEACEQLKNQVSTIGVEECAFIGVDPNIDRRPDVRNMALQSRVFVFAPISRPAVDKKDPAGPIAKTGLANPNPNPHPNPSLSKGKVSEGESAAGAGYGGEEQTNEDVVKLYLVFEDSNTAGRDRVAAFINKLSFLRHTIRLTGWQAEMAELCWPQMQSATIDVNATITTSKRGGFTIITVAGTSDSVLNGRRILENFISTFRIEFFNLPKPMWKKSGVLAALKQTYQQFSSEDVDDPSHTVAFIDRNRDGNTVARIVFIDTVGDDSRDGGEAAPNDNEAEVPQDDEADVAVVAIAVDAVDLNESVPAEEDSDDASVGSAKAGKGKGKAKAKAGVKDIDQTVNRRRPARVSELIKAFLAAIKSYKEVSIRWNDVVSVHRDKASTEVRKRFGVCLARDNESHLFVCGNKDDVAAAEAWLRSVPEENRLDTRKEWGSELTKLAKSMGVLVKYLSEGDNQSVDSSEWPMVSQAVMNKLVTVRVIPGNILVVEADALINPADETMNHDGGLARSISDTAGAGLVEECQRAVAKASGRKLPVTTVISTGAYGLRAVNPQLSHVLHTVGPRFLSGSDSEVSQYRKTVREALTAALRVGARSVSIPLFGSAIFGWPKDLAAQLLVHSIAEWVHDNYPVPSPLSTPIQILLIDTDYSNATEMARALRLFSENGPSFLPQVQPAAPADPPPLPRFLWEWEVRPHEISALPDELKSTVRVTDKGNWVPYDYNETMIIESSLETSAFPVVIRGDISGVGGKQSASYEVTQENATKYGEHFEFAQRHTVSNFKRVVQRRPFVVGMTISGYPTPRVDMLGGGDSEDDIVVEKGLSSSKKAAGHAIAPRVDMLGGGDSEDDIVVEKGLSSSKKAAGRAIAPRVDMFGGGDSEDDIVVEKVAQLNYGT